SIPILTLRQPLLTLLPYTTLFRSERRGDAYCARRFRDLHDSVRDAAQRAVVHRAMTLGRPICALVIEMAWAVLAGCGGGSSTTRSEEHTSELQSRFDLVCRLLLEK